LHHLNSPLARGKQTLTALHRLVRDNISAIRAAISTDLRHRPHDETLLTEYMNTLKSITQLPQVAMAAGTNPPYGMTAPGKRRPPRQ
jgi:hypothetical protein